MGLVVEELAVCTLANECFGVCQSSQSVEPRSEGFSDQRARSNMIFACAFINLVEYFSAFLCAYTLHEYV
jgi:hypothetical protein